MPGSEGDICNKSHSEVSHQRNLRANERIRSGTTAQTTLFPYDGDKKLRHARDARRRQAVMYNVCAL